ncbi:GT1 domain-containing protein isoform X2 [Hemibagrus wyckioides]|uniref:GT1 domain-containing protein isoform X2 n=1 Tax=Hemibagrus wyckioides TaxID=337641 RepID=UPI00266DC6DF|nr:GT1 domain-containing protein isoform X2 [Hemibagrus wyckioides]
MARERAAFFSPFEQEIILKTFEEYKAIITAKCNTAAAAKARVEAWQKIADRLNHANPNNIKRTWQQVKIKYKNIVQSNRKRKQKFGEGLATSGFSPAEEVALWQIRGRPVIDGTLLGLSSEQTGVGVGRPVATEPESSAALIQTVPTILDCAEEPAEHSDSEHDEKNIVVCSHPEEGTEAYTSQEDPGPSGPADGDGERDEDVTALYKRYLRQEIAYRQLKMKKLEKEIQLLDKQLDVS